MKKLLLTASALAFLAAGPAMAQGGPSSEDGYGAQGGPGNGPRAAQMQAKMLERMDENGDGEITESDFIARAKDRFESIDTDNDGKVSPEEARAHHKDMRSKMKEKRGEWREKRQERKEGFGGPHGGRE